MPTLSEKFNASKVRAEQALARRRQLEAQLGKHNRERDTQLRSILGAGAVAGGLVEQCLQHVSEKKRKLAQEILREQAEQVRTDQPQDPPAPKANRFLSLPSAGGRETEHNRSAANAQRLHWLTDALRLYARREDPLRSCTGAASRLVRRREC